MATISTNQFKAGVKLMIDDKPFVIVENQFVKPGKGQAFNTVRLRNLLNGNTLEKNIKSGDSFEAADVTDVEMQFLYSDGEFWHFMDPATYEQLALEAVAVNDIKEWLKPKGSDDEPWLDNQDISIVTLWNNKPIAVTPPNFMILKIVETDPGLRGDTVSGGTKPAKLETGAVVQVPLFVGQDEYIRVNTSEKMYMARATKSK
jgi:elongation factor P